jgi:hypothetical protein
MTTIDRFNTKYTVDPVSGCWNWTASTWGGYGMFRHERGNKAHRFSYEHHTGHILNDLTIDHLCNNTLCVNPEHLEAVAKGENSRRRNLYEYEYTKNEYCKKGHKRDYLNKKTGQLDCKTCKLEAQQRFREKNPGYQMEYYYKKKLDNKDNK